MNMRKKRRKLENAKKNSRQVVTPIFSNSTILTPSQEEKTQRELEREKEKKEARAREEKLEVRFDLRLF